MRLILLCLTLLVAPACSGDGSGVTGSGPVQLRIENQTGLTMLGATLHTLDGRRTFGVIPAGATSPWTAVSAAYRMATTDIVVHPGTTLRLQVIDHVGDHFVPPGRYTYVFSFYEDTSGDRRLHQTFRPD